MKNLRKNKILTLTLLLASLALAWAAGGLLKEIGPEIEFRFFMNSLKQLDLSDSQEKALKVLASEHKSSMQRKINDVKNQLQAFSKIVENPNSTEEELRKGHESLIDVHAAASIEKLEFMINIKKMLTNEQKLKFSEINKEMHKKSPKGSPPGGFAP